FGDGNFTIAGTDRMMSIEQIAQMSFIPVGLPSELGVGLQGAGAFSADVPSFPNGYHICEVEIDQETGAVVLDRYTVVDDIGTVAATPTVMSAILGALAPLGVHDVPMPATPERVWRAIRLASSP